jgi:hypothetical protein
LVAPGAEVVGEDTGDGEVDTDTDGDVTADGETDGVDTDEGEVTTAGVVGVGLTAADPGEAETPGAEAAGSTSRSDCRCSHAAARATAETTARAMGTIARPGPGGAPDTGILGAFGGLPSFAASSACSRRRRRLPGVFSGRTSEELYGAAGWADGSAPEAGGISARTGGTG